ncbi:hypothetical protein ZYGR_0A05380 [Zygosaccharomyces rouxii]|uniref:ZYRO0A12430p n=2 Tax=Zygosaccharomyces rouxii TaxID=4956 RepID=C5DNX6_ZYGRC|nr:uncharacterized protein ZYRO0A12430g [Zygosaccharomyces rouxii]KAH9198509.1 hypothetical protein LQ764DRAFT_137978 [Zygosaccharomyces rouxii]GAV46940.1 hypothetical protein ZYGR_0A05380 [Zygosaccharomyces rouxii]CAR25967.1 ZYRO0A12430p [Zygosaccharomyces rouxii]
MSVIEYCNKETGLQLPNYSECLKFIEDHVVPDMLAGSMMDSKISYRKVTKNDSIRRVVEKLQAESTPITCVFSYGPHIQKMLSILEIYKKVIYKEDKTVKLHQWNKLNWFINKVETHNELIHTRKRVPILLVIIIREDDQLAARVQLESKGFTRQS